MHLHFLLLDFVRSLSAEDARSVCSQAVLLRCVLACKLALSAKLKTASIELVTTAHSSFSEFIAVSESYCSASCCSMLLRRALFAAATIEPAKIRHCD
jgi:hypothetical protein